MPLAVGARLGSYEITAPIGKGGMGEVYRARDTKLGRDVAIKVLPAELASDYQRVARFEREAKLLASLNHPNIATIHGVEESNGVQALVLELVDGPTLADRIAGKPLSVEEAMAIARQIVDALEAGHSAGIVHRDLKPANIKLKEDGTVKVLDYGLAKALVGETPTDTDAALSQSPTLTHQGTQIGVILGTAAYMSPEQAKGGRVDKRTDVFAFGAVLYEMLTGKRAFLGGDVSEVLASVIKTEPDWRRLPENTPESIRRLLRRSLEKEPRRRLPDIAVARLEIDEATETFFRPAKPEPHMPRWQQLALWGLTILAVAATVAAWRGWEPSSAGPATRVVVALPDDQELMMGEEDAVTPLALSPDGRLLVYAAVPRAGGPSRLFLRAMDQFAARPVDGTEGAQAPFFSPDGRWVAFFTEDALQKVSVTGGLPLKVCDTAVLFPSGSWGADGTIVFSHADFGLYQVEASGGEPKRLTTPDGAKGEIRHFRPQFLPGGQQVLFSVATSQGFEMALLSLAARRWETVLEDAESAQYVEAGYLVFSRSGALFAVPFDLVRQSTEGSPVPLLERASHLAGLGAAHFAVSDTGTLAYPPPESGVAMATTLVWVDRQGKVTPIVTDAASYGYPRISPDGRRVAVTATPDIWIYDLDRGTGRRVTTDGYNLNPIWKPDGNRITFSAVRANPAAFFDLHSVAADRSTSPEVLLGREGRQFPLSWHSDDEGLAFFETTASGTKIGVLEGGTPRLLLSDRGRENGGMFSPDGKWLAYMSDVSGDVEVYVTRYPELAGSERVSTRGGWDPVWSRDGRELFYIQGDGLMAVSIESTEPVFTAGPARALFEWRYSRNRRGYDVAPDGQRFVMVQLPDATPSRINLVLNWFEELHGQMAGDSARTK